MVEFSEFQDEAAKAIHRAASRHRGVVYRDYSPEASEVLEAVEGKIRADERRRIFDALSEEARQVPAQIRYLDGEVVRETTTEKWVEAHRDMREDS